MATSALSPSTASGFTRAPTPAMLGAIAFPLALLYNTFLDRFIADFTGGAFR